MCVLCRSKRTQEDQENNEAESILCLGVVMDKAITLEAIVDIDIFMKLAPASVATALANIVLPVPGGPNNRSPLHGCRREM